VNPADVPGEWVALAVRDAKPGCKDDARFYLAAVIPAIRAALADEIEAQQTPCQDHPWPLPRPSCWTCGRNGAFHRAAVIARGEGR
jgi:hypothetical protein